MKNYRTEAEAATWTPQYAKSDNTCDVCSKIFTWRKDHQNHTILFIKTSEIHYLQQGLVRRCIVISGCITFLVIDQIIQLGVLPIRFADKRYESASEMTVSWLSFIEYTENSRKWSRRHVKTEEDTATNQSSRSKEATAWRFHHCRQQAKKSFNTTHIWAQHACSLLFSLCWIQYYVRVQTTNQWKTVFYSLLHTLFLFAINQNIIL